MIDILLDSLIDTLKIIPFLFIAFLIIEFFEHKLNKNNKKFLNNKYSFLVGGVLGMIPQCGFSAMVTNLFSNKIVSIGTLIAVYLSTSDEMLPLLISGGISISSSFKIILFKAFIGILFGFIIDIIFKKNKFNSNNVHEICENEECACNHSLFLGSFIHTIKISLFILIANIIISSLIYYIGIDSIKNILNNGSIFNYLIASIIGLIPNCSASVILTELYISNIISLGIMFSGLLTGSGIGLFLLYKTNHNIKENLMITGILFIIGISVGYIIDLLGIIL